MLEGNDDGGCVMRTYDPVDVEPRPAEASAIDEGRPPGVLWPLVALIGLLVVTGFYGGWSFISDPSGAGLRAELSWLEQTPATDFFLPGLFLLGVYGVGGTVLIVGLIRRPSPGVLGRLDARLGYHWSWAGSIVFGAVLILWIAYELIVMPEQIWIQPALMTAGLAIAGIPLTASMRRWYAVEPSGSDVNGERGGGARWTRR
jgi:hypothetical protein